MSVYDLFSSFLPDNQTLNSVDRVYWCDYRWWISSADTLLPARRSFTCLDTSLREWTAGFDSSCCLKSVHFLHSKMENIKHERKAYQKVLTITSLRVIYFIFSGISLLLIHSDSTWGCSVFSKLMEAVNVTRPLWWFDIFKEWFPSHFHLV